MEANVTKITAAATAVGTFGEIKAELVDQVTSYPGLYVYQNDRGGTFETASYGRTTFNGSYEYTVFIASRTGFAQCETLRDSFLAECADQDLQLERFAFRQYRAQIGRVSAYVEALTLTVARDEYTVS